MRTTQELNREELNELKEIYLTQLKASYNKGVSYDELCEAEYIISDESIHEHYEGTYFCKEDFFCNVI
ncbi:hypothetical protein [Campylobacter troglodytis]|uniref:hypothetical protein n=1 Tax=Campylobacter troglodytis TaxID=654363 RepID=UPI00115840C7|nr:hypothetical protein [Campylobacter troglodytis]TQR53192.1 hypothetical protein DMC01_11775 [Campylobacter troglodytis]